MLKTGLLSLVIGVLLCVFCVKESVGQTKNFYVSPTGNNSNTGSFEQPVATFEAAQELGRNFKKNNSITPVIVYFRGGKHYLLKPVVFSSEDSGSENAPVSYNAYPEEVPNILGGEKLVQNGQNIKMVFSKHQFQKG